MNKLIKNRALLLPFVFYAFLVFYLLLWHISLIAISDQALLAEVKSGLWIKANQYSVFSIGFVVFFYPVLYEIHGKAALRRAFFISSIIIFLYLAFLRVLDWGTIYFSGQHVDNEFWYHAFYSDGTSFMLTGVAASLFGALILSALVFSLLVFRSLSFVKILSLPDCESRTAFSMKNILMINTGLCLAAILAINVLFFSLEGGVKNNGFITELPERKVLGSFIDYAFKSGPNKNAVLDQDSIEKLRKCGINLNSMGSAYPLMKKSIYLDVKNKTSEKPLLKPGTNIIIIFAESLNMFYLQEEVHGIKDITPNFHDMMQNGYTFNKMYGATFPTIKGTIATLGSGLYTIDKIQGIRHGFRPPVICRFLFLSDVLKKYGYRSTHVQGGSGIFGGMRDSFQKQGYDDLYFWESLELQAHVKNRLNREWGIRDEDVLNFAVKLLKKNDFKKPFLLTLSTMDMHSPYEALYTHPNAKGRAILNCLYSTDRSFGKFWDYFKNSPYSKNTALIVVADHHCGGGMEFGRFMSDYRDHYNSMSDFIACIMYMPDNPEWKGKKNETLCTNLDLVPTLLDIMNIDTPNPFLGLSVFSERYRFPAPISNYALLDLDIMKRLNQNEKNYIKKINWNGADQKKFIDFLTELCLQRAIVP